MQCPRQPKGYAALPHGLLGKNARAQAQPWDAKKEVCPGFWRSPVSLLWPLNLGVLAMQAHERKWAGPPLAFHGGLHTITQHEVEDTSHWIDACLLFCAQLIFEGL